MPHDGFGEICACAHAAECGAYRALTPGQRAAGLFPLNQAFSIGGTDLAWSASHGHRSVSLAQFCADVWPPNGTNYWTKRKDAVRHKWQLQNQLTNGKTFGLFENKLLMKRVYRCLDIPFVAPVYSALVPRAGPAAREAERAGWTTADAEGPGGAEGAMLRALNETRGRADERCLVQSHSYKSEVVACPASRPRPPARAGPSIDGPSNHSSSGHLALRGPFAPYSRCAMRHAISRLHHSGREGEVVLKPVSSTMSMGLTVWEGYWKRFLRKYPGAVELPADKLRAVSEVRMLFQAEEIMTGGLTCCLEVMLENYAQRFNHRGVMIEPRYDRAGRDYDHDAGHASRHSSSPPPPSAPLPPPPLPPALGVEAFLNVGHADAANSTAPSVRTWLGAVWELKYVVVGGVSRSLHAIEVPLGTHWVHFIRDGGRAGEPWRCLPTPIPSYRALCAPLLARINAPQNLARVDAWAFRIGRFFGAEWFRMDVFSGNDALGWRVNEVAYVDSTLSPESLDRLFSVRCNDASQDEWVTLPKDPDDDRARAQGGGARGPLSYMAEDLGLPLPYLTVEPEFAWTADGTPWIFDNDTWHECRSEDRAERLAQENLTSGIVPDSVPGAL